MAALQSGNILFADDDDYYCDLGPELLRDHGFNVVRAHDGAECLAQLDQNRVDLAIIDLDMPHVSGFDVLSRIRSASSNGTLPVIVITGHNDTASIERAYHHGATSFMTKPFDWSLFLNSVLFVLKSSQTERELRDAARNIELLRTLQERFMQSLISDAQTPLRTAINFSTLMQLEADGPIGSPYYKTCVYEIARSVQSVSSAHLKLLQWSESLGEAIVLDEQRFVFGHLLQQVLSGMEPVLTRRGHVLATTFEFPNELVVSGDRGLLAQALQGVLDESVQLSRAGGEIDLAVTLDAKAGLTIEIRDCAPRHGTPSKTPASTSSDRSAPRLSAAMQISKSIVEAHGGRFQFVPDFEEGGSTRMTLPSTRMQPK